MGVKCSLLGHDYGDSEIERERDEDGDEVVRTAKRVERCRQCGHTRTISANTEVTALESAAGVVRDPDGTVVAANGSTMAEEIGGSVVIETADDRPADTTEVAEATTAPATDSDDAEAVGNGDGGDTLVIDRIDHTERDGESSRSARAPGEWPAEPAPETATDGRGSSVTGTDAAGWPDEDAPGTAVDGSDGEETANGKRRTRRPGDTLSCGSCGFASPIADSPLRAGDICPDCGTGYLAWETRKG
jgi:hypothetical protein